MRHALRFALALSLGFAPLFPAPGRAADPAPAPAAPRAAAAAKKAGPGVLWWNDPQLLEKLSLSAEQRSQMDQLFKTYEASVRANAIGKPRAGYFGALHQGNYEQARKENDAWAAAAGAIVHADGALKIGALSLLSADQRKALDAVNPYLANFVWTPRPSWSPPPGAGAKGRAPGAPPAGAAKPPGAP
jgi:Spy/CpxP family protein refolding chaperone